MPEQRSSARRRAQVDDGLRDREVERAEVDRDPLVLLELLRRIELVRARTRLRGRDERERRGSASASASLGEPSPLGVAPCSTRRAREPELGRVGERVDATPPPVRAMRRRRRRRSTTTITAIARNIIPKAATPAAARLPVRVRRRCSSTPNACEPTQSTAPSAQPWMRQPASRKTGSARTMTAAPAIAGSTASGGAPRLSPGFRHQMSRYRQIVAATPTGMPTTAPKTSP